MSCNFPEHNDPRKYNDTKAYMLDWARAISKEVSSGEYKIFAGNATRYDLQKRYGMNKQPIDIYKTLNGIDEQAETSMMNVDFTPRGPLPKFRNLAIEKVLLAEYGPVITPIDMLSKDENDRAYAEMKSKLLVKQMLQQVDPELLQNPALQPEQGEPQDMEELEMRMDMGEQFNRAMDAELLVSLAFYENDVKTKRRKWVKDLHDHGIAFYKTFLNDDGRPCFRVVDLRNFVTSRVKNEDFSDMRYAGEFIYVNYEDLDKHFGESEMQKVREQRNVQNPFSSININWPLADINYSNTRNGQALVFDFEFLTYDSLHFDTGKSKFGNPQVKRFFGAAQKKTNRITKSIAMVYTGKWVVGTELIYEFGPAENMMRDYTNPKKMVKTCLNYKGTVYNMHEMVAESFMDRLMPLADDYMMCMLKIQNVRNQMIPNGWAINLDAIESVDLTMGGQAMDKEKVIDMFVKRGLLVYRGNTLSNERNGNGKPIEFMQNSITGEIINLYQELQAIKQEMRDVTGLNEVTDGSTPSDRMLNGVASMAENATNTALRPMMQADGWILENLGMDLLKRAQQAIRRNGYSGFAPALNESSLRFIESNAKVSEREYALKLEVRPNDEQKQWLIGNMQAQFENGMLDISDALMVMNTYNLKQAQMMLAYKVKKNQEQKQREAMEQQQMNGQIQQESAMVAEQFKQQTLQMEYSLKMELEQHITERLLRLKEMDLQSRERIKGVEVEGNLMNTELKNDATAQTQPTGMPAYMDEAGADSQMV